MTTSKRPRRAYIGNLRPRPSLSQNLYNNLFLPHCLTVPNYPAGITVVSPKQHNSTAYALVEFADVDYAIQKLNGVVFDGKTLRVSREKNTNGRMGKSSGGGGFGSSRWAGSTDTDEKRSTRQSKEHTSRKELETHDEVVEGVRRIVSTEIQQSSDAITSSIACTAAVSMLSTMDAFGLQDSKPNEDSLVNSTSSNKDDGDMSNQQFQTRCQLPLSELMDEYGEQDVDWKKQIVVDSNAMTQDGDKPLDLDFKSRCKLPLSELVAEYGEQDVHWKKQQHFTEANTQNSSQNTNNGMLAPYEKSFVHLELVSFGYRYGSPSHSKKGFTYTHPLPPLDCRELEVVPDHVAKFHGLSYLVKKAMLNPRKDDEKEAKVEDKLQSPMRVKANSIADDIMVVLVEAIDEAGHGPISPLTMTISIGSEIGKHRSVVLVEHLAVILRSRLRRNDGRKVKQHVSVETRHRDLDVRHKDDDSKREQHEHGKRSQDKNDDYRSYSKWKWIHSCDVGYWELGDERTGGGAVVVRRWSESSPLGS
eukprot:scaffold39746_cov74-Cyclotella_meneghiniana.AAC.11